MKSGKIYLVLQLLNKVDSHGCVQDFSSRDVHTVKSWRVTKSQKLLKYQKWNKLPNEKKTIAISVLDESGFKESVKESQTLPISLFESGFEDSAV